MTDTPKRDRYCYVDRVKAHDLKRIDIELEELNRLIAEAKQGKVEWALCSSHLKDLLFAIEIAAKKHQGNLSM